MKKKLIELHLIFLSLLLLLIIVIIIMMFIK